jgi:hypothetical protein
MQIIAKTYFPFMSIYSFGGTGRSSASSNTSTSEADHFLTSGVDHSLGLFFLVVRLVLVFFVFRFLAIRLPLGFISANPRVQQSPMSVIWLRGLTK